MNRREFFQYLDETFESLSDKEKRDLQLGLLLVKSLSTRFSIRAHLNEKGLSWFETIGIGGISIRNIIDYISAYIRIALFKVFPSMRKKMLPELYFRAQCVNMRCMSEGECVLCGCKVPDKLFASGPCFCYPRWGWFTKNVLNEIVKKQMVHEGDVKDPTEEIYD